MTTRTSRCIDHLVFVLHQLRNIEGESGEPEAAPCEISPRLPSIPEIHSPSTMRPCVWCGARNLQAGPSGHWGRAGVAMATLGGGADARPRAVSGREGSLSDLDLVREHGEVASGPGAISGLAREGEKGKGVVMTVTPRRRACAERDSRGCWRYRAGGPASSADGVEAASGEL